MNDMARQSVQLPCLQFSSRSLCGFLSLVSVGGGFCLHIYYASMIIVRANEVGCARATLPVIGRQAGKNVNEAAATKETHETNNPTALARERRPTE